MGSHMPSPASRVNRGRDSRKAVSMSLCDDRKHVFMAKRIRSGISGKDKYFECRNLGFPINPYI